MQEHNAKVSHWLFFQKYNVKNIIHQRQIPATEHIDSTESIIAKFCRGGFPQYYCAYFLNLMKTLTPRHQRHSAVDSVNCIHLQ
jgi:hypothetical protein